MNIMKNRIRPALLLLVALATSPAAFAAATGGARSTSSPAAAAGNMLEPASPADSSEPVLRALEAEMKRSQTRLHLEDNPAPYFLSYRVVDIDTWQADAALGGLRSEMRSRIRFLTVELRLGDYKQDSSGMLGNGAMEVVPLDSDEHAIRFQVWSATDKAYKKAIQAFTAKKARLKQLTIDHPVDDFSRADPVKSLRPTVKLPLASAADRKPWLRMLRDASGLYTRDPELQNLQTSLNFRAVNRYYVNSDGAVVRDGELLYRMIIACNTQATDGMRLERAIDFNAKSLRDLPSDAKFQRKTRELMETLRQLRQAPLAAEDYHGPVLFSGDSASTVFYAVIGRNILGIKPNPGQNARVRGQFASSYKMRVLPAFLSLEDDPTLASLEGTPLLGHYAVDDEGVQAQRVPVIRHGILQNYLLGREPVRGFPTSNGHARSHLHLNWPRPALGNLVVQAGNAVPPEELKKQLIAMCKERDLDYGYYVETMAGARVPRLLYRVWANDGRLELVRGAVFGDLDPRAMRNGIVAAGNDLHVDNELEPMPYSVVAPSILFDELQVTRQTANKSKLPEYPSPEQEMAARKKAGSASADHVAEKRTGGDTSTP